MKAEFDFSKMKARKNPYASKRSDYPFEIRPLSAEEGGGYLISYPDFAEYISDGEIVDEALANGREALKAPIAALKAKKLAVPAPPQPERTAAASASTAGAGRSPAS